MTGFYLEPDDEQIRAFGALPTDRPFQMLNLIRLRDRAE